MPHEDSKEIVRMNVVLKDCDGERILRNEWRRGKAFIRYIILWHESAQCFINFFSPFESLNKKVAPKGSNGKNFIQSEKPIEFVLLHNNDVVIAVGCLPATAI